jgi:hypothetical protein
VRSAFEPRVAPASVLALVRACQRRAVCHLGGGVALSGAYLGHRLSADVDVVFHSGEELRSFARDLPGVARESELALQVVQDGGSFVLRERLRRLAVP